MKKWYQNFKQREFKNIFGDILQFIICTLLGKLLLSLLLIIVGTIIDLINPDNIVSVWFILIGAGGSILIFLIWMLFAYIINPIFKKK